MRKIGIHKVIKSVAVSCAILLLSNSEAMPQEQQNNLAPSYIGLCSARWPCAKSLAVFDGIETKTTGWLIRTFGIACPCAKEFFNLSGKKFARIHLANCTCFPERGRRCAKDEPFAGESIASANRKLERRDRGILAKYRSNLLLAQEQLKDLPDPDNTTVVLSLCLESVFSTRARRVMLAEARKVFPSGYAFVDNPVKGACLPGLICERHGANPGRMSAPCIVDTDGDDYRAVMPPKYPQCLASMLWEPGFNLLDLGRNAFQEPRRRTEAPSEHDFEMLRRTIIQGAFDGTGSLE